jgi:hypothetical protein
MYITRLHMIIAVPTIIKGNFKLKLKLAFIIDIDEKKNSKPHLKWM